MPFIPNAYQDEEQPLQGAIAPGAGGTRLSPGGVGSTTGAGTAPAPKDAGGQFATLQSYLTANQGQAAPLANKITSGIQNQYSTLQGQNAATLGDIGSQVSANALPGNASDVLTREAANPVSFAGDQGNVKQFQNLLGATYGGPATAEGTSQYQKQQAALNNAIATGTAQTGTEAGRKQLLSQNEARPTTGVTALNSAILTQSPDYLSQVQGAYKPFSNLLSGLSTGAQGINQNIAKMQGNVASANAAANKQIADQTAALNTGVNTGLTKLQDIYGQYNTGAADFASQLQGGKLPVGYGIDPGLQAFITKNLTPWLKQYTPGFTPTYNFANAVPTFPTAAVPTINQAATPQDFATFQALGTLAGAPVASPLAGLNPQLAGTYTTPTLPNVNNKLLAGDIYSGFNSSAGPINVGASAFGQYNALLAALDRYQGKTSDPNLYAGGNNGQFPADFFTNPNYFGGYLPPTIA